MFGLYSEGGALLLLEKVLISPRKSPIKDRPPKLDTNSRLFKKYYNEKESRWPSHVSL